MSGWACRACGKVFKRERDWKFHEYNCPHNAAKPDEVTSHSAQHRGGNGS